MSTTSLLWGVLLHFTALLSCSIFLYNSGILGTAVCAGLHVSTSNTSSLPTVSCPGTSRRLTSVSPVAGDISCVDVFREFSLLASLQPEKLRRRSLQFSHYKTSCWPRPHPLTAGFMRGAASWCYWDKKEDIFSFVPGHACRQDEKPSPALVKAVLLQAHSRLLLEISGYSWSRKRSWSCQTFKYL